MPKNKTNDTSRMDWKTLAQQGLIFNFVHKDMSKDDVDLFFGDFENMETIISIDDTWTLGDIAVSCGIFPSKSRARKNGWDGNIEQGYSHFLNQTKKKKQIFILNKIEE